MTVFVVSLRHEWGECCKIDSIFSTRELAKARVEELKARKVAKENNMNACIIGMMNVDKEKFLDWCREHNEAVSVGVVEEYELDK